MGASQQMLAATGGVPRVYATWDPANKGTSITLSNGNLTAVGNGTSGCARSTIAKSAGKWYWEITCSVVGAECGIGSGNASANLNGDLGQANSISYNSNGNIFKGAAFLSAPGAYVTGAVIGLAYDADASTLAYYRNNTLMYTVTATNTIAGALYAMLYTRDATSTLVANFGATALTYTPPSGFNAGLYT